MAVTRVELPVRAEREVDQLDVVDGDVGAGVAAGDPLGELAAADRLRLQQRAVAVVDVLQHAVGDVRAQLLVVGVGELVIDDLGQHAVLARPARRARRVPASDSTDGFSIRTCLPAASAARAARSGGRRAWRRRRHRRRPRAAASTASGAGEAGEAAEPARRLAR